MSGTREGGLKARATNYKLHGDDFYKKIGATGGRNGHYGGFNIGDSAKKNGSIGGKLGRRGRKLLRKIYLPDRIEAIYENKLTGEKEKVVIKK